MGLRLTLPGPDEYAPHTRGKFPTPSRQGRASVIAGRAGGHRPARCSARGSNEFQVGGEVDTMPHLPVAHRRRPRLPVPAGTSCRRKATHC